MSLERATNQGRVVITHDLAFGRSATGAGATFVELLTGGRDNTSAMFVLGLIDALRTSIVELEPPFIAVAEGTRPPSVFAREPRRRGRYALKTPSAQARTVT